jgi:pyruvate/2-oxoglutarate dehydrogenase complex dihydrolipoamide acyltransferase (E2) component
MALGDRCDGVRLKKLSGFRKMFPYMMRTRTESVIYHAQRLSIRDTLAWLDGTNAGREPKITFFQVVLAACVRTLALRPEANRFVAGRRIYQRRTIDLSFVVKRELTEQAGEMTVKISFDPRSTVAGVAERVNSIVRETRQNKSSRDEGTADLIAKLPRCLARLAFRGVRSLDYFGRLPASFIKGDALYTSVFLANLGSIGLDTVLHHMYEWGNAAFFIVVGKRKKEPVANERGELEVQNILDMTISIDERITDGFYYANTIRLLAHLIENPGELEVPPDNLPDPFELA